MEIRRYFSGICLEEALDFKISYAQAICSALKARFQDIMFWEISRLYLLL